MLWGGPTQPTTEDNLWTFFERFFGGVTTAHGINRVFDDDIGIVRRIFWLALFAGGFYAAIYYGGSSVMEFLDSGVITVLSEADHTGELPRVTVCASSPVRCSCEAFYDEEVLAANFRKVAPYLCAEVIVYQDMTTEGTADEVAPDLAGIDKVDGSRTAFTTYEKADAMIHRELTMARIKELKESGELLLSNCDGGKYTKQWFIDKVKAADLSYMDLIMYAGYTRRTQLVKECMVVDSQDGSATYGQKVSCMNDGFWSDGWVDENYGACHTFNPCQGVPVGAKCQADEDCLNDLNTPTPRSARETSDLPEWAVLPGGFCDTDAETPRCACNACKGGKNCMHAVQAKPGKGMGMRLILNTAVEEDAPLNSASNSRWSPGAMVHMHSGYDQGRLSKALILPPGQVTEISVGRRIKEEMEYPYTNCSETFNIDPALCRQNCLRREQVNPKP